MGSWDAELAWPRPDSPVLLGLLRGDGWVPVLAPSGAAPCWEGEWMAGSASSAQVSLGIPTRSLLAPGEH